MNAKVNVREFRPAATLAVSRNREDALKAIVPRLLEMAECVEETTPGPQPWKAFAFGPGFALIVFKSPSLPGAVGVNVRPAVNNPTELLVGPPLFSAWLNCPSNYPRATYMDGKVHVMSWKRGWESALINAPRVPQ